MLKRGAANSIPAPDVEQIVSDHGILKLNQLSTAHDVAEAARALATSANSLDDVSRAQCKALARRTLNANQVVGGSSAITAAFKAATRRATPALHDSTFGREELLPHDVVFDTDLANAYRLSRDYGDNLRHVAGLGWLVWDGKRWACDANAAKRFAHLVACSIEATAGAYLQEAAELSGEGRADEAAKCREKARDYHVWAKRSQQERRMDACLNVAESLDGIAIGADALDADPWFLNCLNGTLDLRTGTLSPHRRDDLITRLVPVEFHPEAVAPTFERFLTDVFPVESLRDFVRRFAGYSLTGTTREQCFVVLHGCGSNGKSTLLEILRTMLGDYAAAANTDALMASPGRKGPQNDIARLRGARLVTAAESGEERRLDEELVKQLTGGDKISARLLYREFFEFTPTFKLWLAVNDKPEIRGVDHGIWRRVRLIPFESTFTPEQQDRDLPAKLRAELPGILAWAVRGCVEWLQVDLRPPDAVTNATKEWQEEANVAAQFIDDYCIRVPAAKTKCATLYGAYAEWSRSQGIEPMTSTMFGKRLGQLGFQKTKTSTGWFRTGVAPRASESRDA